MEHASSDGRVGEDEGCCTLLRLLKFTDAVKELHDRGEGSRPLVLQKGVEDGIVGGLNSGSDDQDLSEAWGRGFEGPVCKDGVMSRDTGQHTV